MSHRKIVLDAIAPQTIGAEIGVWKGEFSEKILTANPKKLHLIDPWKFRPDLPGRWFGGYIARSQKDMDDIYSGVQKKLGSKPNVKIHREAIETFVDNFPDEYFDWVYIDGDHGQAKRDIVLLTPKVKKGGLVMGDDYSWGGASPGLSEANLRTCPVALAVRDVTKEGLLSMVTVEQNQFILLK
jgi:hypothetical protein